MLARIMVKRVELVVMVQRRIELQDWAMKETSRHSRSPIFLFGGCDVLKQLWSVTLNNSFRIKDPGSFRQ